MENKNTLFGIYYDWWKNIDKFLFPLIVLLFLTGLFFSLVSTSLIASDKLDTNDYQFFFNIPTEDEKLVDFESLMIVRYLFWMIICWRYFKPLKFLIVFCKR